MHQGSYEFTAGENETINRTAQWARVLGVVVLLEGLFKLLEIKENPVGTVISIAIAIAIGLAFINGGQGLQKVVNSEGNDVVHLMEGLTQLTRAFTIRIVILTIALVIVGLGVLVVACLGVAAMG